MSYITTYTGKAFDPLNASEVEIDFCDIAHALSLLCRANGHFPHFYSVAQHSINCMKEAKARGYSKRVQLGCLLHDASEAYLSDVTRPIKALLPNYLDFEKKLQNTIFDKWIAPSLTEDELTQIFEVDDALLYYEFLHMMNERVLAKEPILKSIPNLCFKEFESIEKEYVRTLHLLSDNESLFVGVDWMHGKWIAAEIKDNIAQYKTFSDIADLQAEYGDKQILIDVPIGLPESVEQAELRPDIAARNYLKEPKRKSCIFNVPFRQMVYAETKDDAWKINKTLGAKISKQGLGILPCIRQVDEFLCAKPENKELFIESHPECAFQALNRGIGLSYSKHKTEGIVERRNIISPYVSNIDELLNSVKPKQREDLLDALSLAVTAQVGFKSIVHPVHYDNKGLPMKIVVADI